MQRIIQSLKKRYTLIIIGLIVLSIIIAMIAIYTSSREDVPKRAVFVFSTEASKIELMFQFNYFPMGSCNC